MPSRQRWLAAAYILLPLAALAVDYAASPVLFETTQPLTITVLSLLERDRIPLGTFRSHQIEMGLSSVGDDDYLAADRDTEPNALAVSVFSDEEGQPATAAFAKAVFRKLEDLAPPEATKLAAFLKDSTGFQPGDVRALQLSLTPEQRQRFPVDWIFVAVLTRESGSVNEEYLGKISETLMTLAAQKEIATLALPAIGYNWEDDHPMSLDSIFRSVLNALKAGPAPARIYFDLYDQWPTFVIERAVTALNGAAEQFVQPAAGEKEIHHRDLRLLLLLLSLCLAVSAFVAPLNLRAFLIISAAYIGLFLGSGAAINLLTGSLEPGTRTIVQIVIYLALAVAFPFIARWKLDLVFGSRESS
jgi:hypothetical protein